MNKVIKVNQSQVDSGEFQTKDLGKWVISVPAVEYLAHFRFDNEEQAQKFVKHHHEWETQKSLLYFFAAYLGMLFLVIVPDVAFLASVFALAALLFAGLVFSVRTIYSLLYVKRIEKTNR